MSVNLSSEAKMLSGFIAVLAVVIIAAAFAMQQTTSPEPVAIEDLPTARWANDGWEPSESACADAGGEVRYERTSECFWEPNVHDVCGFGVPCFDGGSVDRTTCIDVKDPFCGCASDDQCPDGYVCDKTYAAARCHRAPGESIPPKPLMR